MKQFTELLAQNLEYRLRKFSEESYTDFRSIFQKSIKELIGFLDENNGKTSNSN